MSDLWCPLAEVVKRKLAQGHGTEVGMARVASVERNTKETRINGRVDLDGTGASEISTGIGSGGGYALAAARALICNDAMDAENVARRAMTIAAGICIYTNDKITLEKLEY